MAPEELRLVCDEMLGRLATWLRLLGIDTAYVRRSDDPAELDRAIVDGRLLITRARLLAERYAPALLVRGDDVRTQLGEVLAALGQRPPPARWFTRCARCNVPLVPAAPDEVRDRVPALPLRSFTSFTRCPRCERVYWPGGHHERFLRAVADVLLEDRR